MKKIAERDIDHVFMFRNLFMQFAQLLFSFQTHFDDIPRVDILVFMLKCRQRTKNLVSPPKNLKKRQALST